MPYKDHVRKVQRDKEYRLENLSRLRRYDKDRYHHGGKKKAQEEYFKSLRGGYVTVRSRAKKYHREFTLTFEQYCAIIKHQRCIYCKADLSKCPVSVLRNLDPSMILMVYTIR